MFKNASLSCCWQLYRRNLCEEAIHHSSDLNEHQNRAALRFRVSVLSLVAHSPLHSYCKSGKAKEWQIALAGDLIYLVLVIEQLSAERKRREHERSLPLTSKTSIQLKYQETSTSRLIKIAGRHFNSLQKVLTLSCRTICFLFNATTVNPSQYCLSYCITHVMYCFRWTKNLSSLSLKYIHSWGNSFLRGFYNWIFLLYCNTVIMPSIARLLFVY